MDLSPGTRRCAGRAGVPGILLASLSAVALDPILNRASGDSREAVEAAKAADAH